MNRRSSPEDDEATLFDLPLHRSKPSSPPATDPEPEVEDKPADDEPFGPLPEVLVPEDPAQVEAPNISFAMTLPFDGDARQGGAADEGDASEIHGSVPAGFGSLLLAGLVDLGLIFVGMVTAVLGAAALGVPPGPDDWPAFLLLGLTVSFPYFVVPLAFWGRSAGMAAFSLFSHCEDGRPLSFRQAVIRWIAAAVTVASFGLAALVALSGRSLADRLSGTVTLIRH